MRSFIALPVDDATTSTLMNLQSGLPNVRWVMPDDLHVTLAFLGDITKEQQNELDYQLSTLTLFEQEIIIDGLGAFERGGQTSSVWAGVEPSSELVDLAQQVRRACKAAQIDYDETKFRPHVTLARFSKRSVASLQSWIAERGDLAKGDYWCESFSLYSSTLKSDGARYAAVADYPLASFTGAWDEGEG